MSTGPRLPGSRCRRWSMASRTSPAPSATAPLCASWPSAPAPEPSSCILSVLPAPTQGCPGRARGPGIGEIQERPSIEKQVADDPSCSRDVPNTLLRVSPECSKWRPGMGPTRDGPHPQRISRLGPGLCPDQRRGGLGLEELCEGSCSSRSLHNPRVYTHTHTRARARKRTPSWQGQSFRPEAGHGPVGPFQRQAHRFQDGESLLGSSGLGWATSLGVPPLNLT